MSSGCGCIYVDSYDSPEFYSVSIRRARKRYRCQECLKDIQPGASYQYVAGKWFGSFDQIRTCLTCCSIREVFFCEGFEHYNLYEYLDEHIENMGGDIASECLVKLSPEARAIVCDKMEGVWERLYGDEESD